MDTIFEQIKQPWRVFQDNHRFYPLWGLLEIKKWGSLQKDKVDNTYEWAIWWWASKKTKEQGPFIATKGLRQNPQSIAHDIKDYHWAMFRHIMEFLKQFTSLKKTFQEHYFTNIFKDLSNKDLVTLCELLATEITKPQKRLYATPRRRA